MAGGGGGMAGGGGGMTVIPPPPPAIPLPLSYHLFIPDGGMAGAGRWQEGMTRGWRDGRRGGRMARGDGEWQQKRMVRWQQSRILGWYKKMGRWLG